MSYAYDGVSYSELFNGPGLPAGWAGSENASVTGDVLQVVGASSWNQAG